jgi:hypothetical protein
MALLAALGLVVLIAASCSNAAPTPEVVEKEVTRVVTQEVPVEVTREVQVTQVVEVTPPSSADLAAEWMPDSLHGTTRGMGYFYSKEQGGFETLTGIPYEQLPCQNCHTKYNKGDQQGETRCEACHIADPERFAPPQASVKMPQYAETGLSGCLSCHRRQGFEYTKTTVVLDENGQPVTDPVKGTPYEVPAITDVHRSPSPNGKSLACVNCHDTVATHGDGNTYNNLFDSPNTQCTDCHAAEKLSQTEGHTAHADDMTCAACHAQTVVSCQGCHLNEVIAGGPEFPYQRVFGWKFLVRNNEGKIDLGNLMTAMYTDDQGDVKSIAVMSPYYDHSIGKPKDVAALCAQCHDNPAVKAYAETGQIVISKWDEKEGKVVFPNKGVIPVPQDYQSAFQIVFPVISNIDEVVAAWKEGKPQTEVEKLAKWVLGDSAPDMWQMNYATPLEKMPPQMQFDFPTP